MFISKCLKVYIKVFKELYGWLNLPDASGLGNNEWLPEDVFACG